MARAMRWLAAATATALILAAPLQANAREAREPARTVDRLDSARRGADYLVAHEGADGTFFGDPAPHHVAETLVALVAGGVSGDPVARALAAIAAAGPAAASRAGEAGLLVMGIVAAGENPRDFHGGDYVARLQSFYNPLLGEYDTQMFQNALAMLGALAAGETLPREAITFLRVIQCVDGGFPVQIPCGAAGGHVDVTAMTIDALVRAGIPASDPLRANARTFLIGAQNAEGAFGDGAGKSTNANSTGLALTAIAALGESATAPPWRQPDGDDPVARLGALQQQDGSFRQSAAFAGALDLATRQAVPGMAARALPLA
jgi:hypothetical protein